MRNLLPFLVGTLVAGGGLTAFVATRFGAPAPVVVEEPRVCTTCDARQASKRRLSDYLQSQTEE